MRRSQDLPRSRAAKARDPSEAVLTASRNPATPALSANALAESDAPVRAAARAATTEAVRALVREGRWSGDEVAALLSLRRRTFNRRLQQEGTTFRSALANVRFEAARELLRDPQRQIPEVARLLGYSGASAFTRAFRHWSGTTPGRWRAGR
jgi:AraC-like DNA-binding protein